MITKLFSHKYAKDPKDYPKILNLLEENFKDWRFLDMKGVASLKDSIHYHIKSKNAREKGVIEITMAPKLNGKIEIKIADNRMKEWSKQAVNELGKFLKE